VSANERPSATFSASWRVVALWSLSVGVAAVTTLAVVTAVEGADALATVALALAIIAFIVQIMIFVAQSLSITAQTERGEELATATRTLLAQIDARGHTTFQAVSEQRQLMIDGFLKMLNVPTQDRRTVTPEDLEQLYTEPSTAAPSTSREGEREFPPADSPADNQRAIEVLETFPPKEDLDEQLQKLRELTPDQLSTLIRVTSDEIYSRLNLVMTGPGIFVTPNEARGLRDLGLVEMLPEYRSSLTDHRERGLTTLVRLTSVGRRVARLLSAPPPFPDGLKAEDIPGRNRADRLKMWSRRGARS
jgi:DNA-directed RNA polymerase specialized sigma24 family protein